MLIAECKSWVWKASTEECDLKNHYDDSKNTKVCEDCVAYAEGGTHVLFEASKRTVEKPTLKKPIGTYKEWAQKEGIWMPRAIASVLCTFTEGIDQPEKYNMEGSPMALEHPYMCCNECAKLLHSELTTSIARH